MITRLLTGRVAAAAAVLAGSTVVAVAKTSSSTTYADVPQGVAALTVTQKALLKLAYRYGPASGIRYVWGGSNPYGFDCSGFVYYIHRRAGIAVPRDSRSQYWQNFGTRVPRGQERPGDVVFFHGSTSGVNAGPPPGHVGIYVGKGRFIEYYRSGYPAHYGSLFYSGGYMGAKRWYTPLRVPQKLLGTIVWTAWHWKIKVAGDSGNTVTFKPWNGKRFDAVKRQRIVRWAHHLHHKTSGNRSNLLIHF